MEIKTKNFQMEDKSLTLAIARNITDRKEYERELKEQKEQLQASNEQLTAFSEEVTAMNKDLKQSFNRIENLNKRFYKLIDLTSILSKYQHDNQNFLSDLLKTAVDILPEADYGIIYTYEDGYVNFIDCIGYDLKDLQKLEIPAAIFSNQKKPIEIKTITELEKRTRENLEQNDYKSFDENSLRIFTAFHNLASAFFELQEYNKSQGEFTQEMITSIINILDIYDEYTRDHSENVAEMAAEIAENMDLPRQKIREAYWAGMIHDIGKLIIPEEILNKDDPLTDEEYNLVKKHPVWTNEAFMESDRLKDIALYALYHHERWDGRGYPEGLGGEDIPLISQILALADAWDAMRSDRAYRDPLSREAALKEISANKGTQFAPQVVEVFLQSKIVDNKEVS